MVLQEVFWNQKLKVFTPPPSVCVSGQVGQVLDPLHGSLAEILGKSFYFQTVQTYRSNHFVCQILARLT